MVTVVLTFGAVLLVARWASSVAPNGWLYTILVMVAVMTVSPIVGVAVGLLLSLTGSHGGVIAPQEYFLSGLLCGATALIATPLIVWYYRRQKKRGIVSAQAPVRSAFDALRR
ncbi:hypothetical protein [Pseudorhodoplanes sp.]|uniref:hypothetical protein n=1 Tax=Pseudorhodoplanes sp. TaxID=1934341 RepID=UPI002B78EF49|nr:hypothetical protein [Pseudorhodoplanes sp.]HWV54027.1 hypothetical protein [Pseudorhodoplanes sp.]